VTECKTEQRTRDVQYTECVPEKRTCTEHVVNYRNVPEERTEHYTVMVPHQVEKEVCVQVCHMAPKEVCAQTCGCDDGCYGTAEIHRCPPGSARIAVSRRDPAPSYATHTSSLPHFTLR